MIQIGRDTLLNKKHSIISDISLNIFSITITTGIMQLVVYPMISSFVPIGEFGYILTLMGLVNVISVVVGGSLNNVQLINRTYYLNEEDYYGDFKRLFILSLFISMAVSLLILGTNVFNILLINKLLLLLVILFTTLRAYLTVYWRIELNYRFILYHSITTSIGYLVGTYLVKISIPSLWPLAFLSGEIFSAIYLFFKTDFFQRKLSKSNNFIKIKRDYVNLLSSNIVSNILIYFDRFILQGTLGAKEVSIYFAASVFGKLSSMILQPISGVFLSYLSREDKDSKKKYFVLFLSITVISGVILFVISIIFSPILVRVLYSELFEDAMPFMNLANLSSILLTIGSLFQPVLLKFTKLYWQNVIQILYAVLFIMLSLFLINKYQLIGFVYASLFANLFRLLLFILVGYFSIWRNKNND
ncbi:lipopolysaccharide biosynthesis protein [Enterococcus faecium]|uniref:lipopolysaccharide biosynthesis protein n=1 Tax=Enterococcus faecium TaxID=1352 RepID=UPI0001B6CC48|nr:hypothetical protein [Enterococcus faecium]EEV61051.1 predicted protein [Enterococcus faecium Com15]MDQ8312210.1 hypothetical protein [Enterococcus faecium]MXS07733.1 hypothetical protein [Enterococcus faecium]